MSASSIAASHLHVAQVLCDDEELGRLQARRHGLADVDAALDHDAVHRRADLGALEVDLRLRERRLALLDRGHRARDLRPGSPRSAPSTAFSCSACVSDHVRARVDSRRDEASGPPALLALQVALASARSSFAREPPPAAHATRWPAAAAPRRARRRGRPAPGAPVLEGCRVDAGDQLALLHLGVEVGVEVLHLTNLRADLHRGHRVGRATCRSPRPPPPSARARPSRRGSALRRCRCATGTSTSRLRLRRR